MNLIRSVAILAAAVLVLGCGTPLNSNLAVAPTGSTNTIEGTPSEGAGNPRRVAPETVPTNNEPSRPVTSASVASTSLPGHLDPESRLSQERSVYFDFDDATIASSDAMWLVELHGDYLLKQPLLAIKIEGNSDEWGGAEYNLALGQKRAEAVARVLTLYGVKSSQLEVISWGKERPKAKGHDELSWAENRRADLVYPTP